MGKRGKSNRFNVFLNYKLWLSSMSGDGIISEVVYTLLNGIRDKGSLKAAAEAAGISYRKAWGDLKQAESMLGYDLTEKTRGGKKGGHSELTPAAKKLLEAYAALQEKLDDAVEEAYLELKKKMEN
ncbi:MAG: LysR family transcriptional regulator [Bacteroidales bacterium]|nr:LysR family transcriptional regulator [Bacteroidales bacterium]